MKQPFNKRMKNIIPLLLVIWLILLSGCASLMTQNMSHGGTKKGGTKKGGTKGLKKGSFRYCYNRSSFGV